MSCFVYSSDTCNFRNRSWYLAKHSALSSTLTVPSCRSASVQPPGAGAVGCKPSSVPSLNLDHLLLIASLLRRLLCVRFLLQRHYKSLFIPLCHSELIRTPDGGQISLDWVDNEASATHPESSTRPTVLILPGLTGNSQQWYVLQAISQATRHGYRSAPSLPVCQTELKASYPLALPLVSAKLPGSCFLSSI